MYDIKAVAEILLGRSDRRKLGGIEMINDKYLNNSSLTIAVSWPRGLRKICRKCTYNLRLLIPDICQIQRTGCNAKLHN